MIDDTLAGQPTRTHRYPRRSVLTALAVLPAAAIAGCGRGGGSKKPPAATPAGSPEASAAAAAPSSASAASSGPSPRQPDTLYYPPPSGEWEKADPAKTGWSPAGLSKLVTFVKENKSATFMMLCGGRILAEEYFLGATASTTLDVASVQKSVASTLLGIAAEKRLLQLDESVSKYLPLGWSKATAGEEAKISIRHLMTHSSGLDPRTLRRVAEPGTIFDYNTNAYQKTRPVLEKAAGTEINEITRAWLFDTIGGGTEAKWLPRPNGDSDPTGAPIWGLNMTARSMARFGLASLRRGMWDGTKLIESSWYDQAWASSKVKPDYGLLWWLMGKRNISGAPKDWVAALGARDQKIYVVPSLDLVVTRQGGAAAEESETFSNFDTALLKAIMAART